MSEEYREKQQQEIREKWAKYAAAKGQRIYLEHYRKSMLAILQKEAMAEGFESVAAQDREARSHSQYTDILEGIKVATEEEELHRGEVKMAEWKFEAWKARVYADQREAKRYGH